MMTQAEKVRLGIFVLVSGAIVIAVFSTLAGIKLMEESDMYKAQFEETVSGLEIGAQVKYNGVRVGQVAGIKINPQKIDQIRVKRPRTSSRQKSATTPQTRDQRK